MTLYDIFNGATLYDPVTKIMVVDSDGRTTDAFMFGDYKKRQQYDGYEVSYIYPVLVYERGKPKALIVIEVRDKEEE